MAHWLPARRLLRMQQKQTLPCIAHATCRTSICMRLPPDALHTLRLLLTSMRAMQDGGVSSEGDGMQSSEMSGMLDGSGSACTHPAPLNQTSGGAGKASTLGKRQRGTATTSPRLRPQQPALSGAACNGTSTAGAPAEGRQGAGRGEHRPGQSEGSCCLNNTAAEAAEVPGFHADVQPPPLFSAGPNPLWRPPQLRPGFPPPLMARHRQGGGPPALACGGGGGDLSSVMTLIAAELRAKELAAATARAQGTAGMTMAATKEIYAGDVNGGGLSAMSDGGHLPIVSTAAAGNPPGFAAATSISHQGPGDAAASVSQGPGPSGRSFCRMDMSQEMSVISAG